MSDNLVTTAIWDDVPIDISKESDFIWSIALTTLRQISNLILRAFQQM